MSRPPVNGLDFQFLELLGQVSDEIATRDEIRVVLITSKFKVFGAGLDLKMASQMDTNSDILFDNGWQVSYKIILAGVLPLSISR